MDSAKALEKAKSSQDIIEQAGIDTSSFKSMRRLDEEDELKLMRSRFYMPTVLDLKQSTHKEMTEYEKFKVDRLSIYLCGNSLGLQPIFTPSYLSAQLTHWRTKGVYTHFQNSASPEVCPPTMDIDETVKPAMAKIVGALPEEVAVMQTLTVNLHLLMASFYKPTRERYKIILEGKAFPSDHYAVESHLQMHNLDTGDAMVLIEPPSKSSPILPTSHILSMIHRHAEDAALLLLPGIQYYTGQLFDIATITSHAHSKGITVGWDLAHAVGNVPLSLHDWNVDFAAWCNYKYMNCGPGAIGGLFVHEKHTQLSEFPSTSNGTISPEKGEMKTAPKYRPRLSGWWGSNKDDRFSGVNTFVPSPGAAGFQLSNPSSLDLAAVRASLRVFDEVDMAQLRSKSLKLTAMLEQLLMSSKRPAEMEKWPPYMIITPSNPSERGAQLSVKLDEGLLEGVMKVLEEEGVVVDERKPDVIRVAPCPLYNTFGDVWRFVEVFREACRIAIEEKEKGTSAGDGAVMVEGGKRQKGWKEIK